MRGVRRSWLPDLQTDLEIMLVDDIHEPVAPDGVIALEVASIHVPELDSTYSGVLCPDILDILQSKGFPGYTGQDLRFVVLVICLLRYAKQLAKMLNLISFGVPCVQVVYCLAPAFFLIWMLNLASATLISSSYASALISAFVSCARSSLSSAWSS